MHAPSGARGRNLVKNLVRWAVTAAFLTAIAWFVPLREVGGHLRRADWLWLAAGTFLTFLSSWLQALRWKWLLGEDAPAVGELFGWTLVGIGAGMFLPSSMAADGARAVLMGRERNMLGRSLISAALARVSGLGAVILVWGAGVLLWPRSRQIIATSPWLIVATAIVAMVATVLLARWALQRRQALDPGQDKPWRMRLERGIEYLRGILSEPVLLVKVLAVSVALQTLGFLGTWCLFLAVGVSVHVGAILALLPVVVLGSLAPVSLGGVGLREGVLIGLFHHFGLASAEACLASSALGYLILALLGGSGAVWWLRRRAQPLTPAS